ncbi:hypothetical protein L1987_68124 [Smallanthus sonchifolius]|uniref:Uncharacterized protein n=1 Tax=Smallanthus sonchifolius TaxID=185202 RepID=A0ACB9B346_9ASTR|nr:hypothetical protein L1987_68124 [Smallanthus sonchifolius]
MVPTMSEQSRPLPMLLRLLGSSMVETIGSRSRPCILRRLALAPWLRLLVKKAETIGFFQVVNHGVPLELLELLKVAAHHFFGQPAEKKAMYLKEVSPSSMVKYGTSFVPEKEKALEWKDYVSMKFTNDADALEFWPNECKEVALEYIKASTKTVKKLLQALIGNLGVILDDSRLNALIVKTSLGNEEWIEIPPFHGALVINIGDTLQILNNGRYKSAEHGVLTTSVESRVSVPIFNSPLPWVNIGPLPELVACDEVARYREVVFEEYMKSFFSNSHDGKKSLDFAST